MGKFIENFKKINKKVFLFITFFLFFVFSSSFLYLNELQAADLQLNSKDILKTVQSAQSGFQRVEVGEKEIYYKMRTIDGAIVENDFVSYEFDKDSEVLLDTRQIARTEVPPSLPDLKISKQEAESLVDGQILNSQLYLIDEESDIFALDPAPENPCWVVKSSLNGITELTVVDALTGENLGKGIAPPGNGFVFSGPIYVIDCQGKWEAWVKNAEDWFEAMGYKSDLVYYPSVKQIEAYIQNPNTEVFFELAHGNETGFTHCCDGVDNNVYAEDIKKWLENRDKMKFAFIGSCQGMCRTENDGTFSYAFRKGSNSETSTVGYCRMAADKCFNCWLESINWQDTLFDYLNKGLSVKQAFDNANTEYPMCAPPTSCMRFAGDPNLKLKNPQSSRCLAFDITDDGKVNMNDLLEVLNRWGNGYGMNELLGLFDCWNATI